MASIQQCPRRLSTSQSCQSTSGLLQLQIPSNSQSTSQHPSPQPALFSSHAHSPQPKVECFSLEGFLYMKCQGGALTFLQSRKRLYFGLEELENKLIYYRDKADFDRKRDCLGTIPLNNALCSLIEGNLCAFVLHTGGKKYVMEAENEMSAHCWLNALQQRRDINDNHVNSLDIPIPPPPPSYNVTNAIRRHRSRSRSEPSDSDSHAENPRRMSRSGRKLYN
ncbi:PH domain-containing protein [Ditylenchus destructor]|nr:PH domain-containing protein [Ditylenchus destructor]